MDKLHDNSFLEYITGYQRYIAYSLEDLKTESQNVEMGRNGIITLSKHPINLKLNPQFRTEYDKIINSGNYDFKSSNSLLENENLLLSDETGNLNIYSNIEFVLMCLNISNKINNPNENLTLKDQYEQLAGEGVDVRPSLLYNLEDRCFKFKGIVPEDLLEL